MHEETVWGCVESVCSARSLETPDAQTLRVEYLHLENKTNATPFHFNQKSCDRGKMHNKTTPWELSACVCTERFLLCI